MRLRRITWRLHETTITRERHDLKVWLEGQGAIVDTWMLEWWIYWT